MTEDVAEPAWISEYDYPKRRVTLTLCSSPELRVHWTSIRRDDDLSDPNGSFVVFTASRAEAVDVVVKVIARLDDVGDLLVPHPDFNTSLIGSLTIWPYKIAGERTGLDHWVWWSTGPAFTAGPRDWAVAMRRLP